MQKFENYPFHCIIVNELYRDYLKVWELWKKILAFIKVWELSKKILAFICIIVYELDRIKIINLKW